MADKSSDREDLLSSIIPTERIEQRILIIRGEKVILDVDLAALYGVTNKRLKEQVRRNRDRFPGDFMFELALEEKAEVAAICGHLSNMKYFKGLPYAFAEHGAIMAPPARPDAPAPPDKRRIGFHAEDSGTEE